MGINEIRSSESPFLKTLKNMDRDAYLKGYKFSYKDIEPNTEIKIDDISEQDHIYKILLYIESSSENFDDISFSLMKECGNAYTKITDININNNTGMAIINENINLDKGETLVLVYTTDEITHNRVVVSGSCIFDMIIHCDNLNRKVNV